MNELTDYQKKIVSRLEKGEIIRRSRMGPFTGPFRFKGDKAGLNSSSIQKLRFSKIVVETSKMTMHGVAEYVHLPGQEPWTKDDSWRSYQKYKEAESSAATRGRRR